VHRAVLTEDNKRAAFRALQDRILTGAGRASPEQRARAFSNAGLAQPLDGLLGKVATRPTQVTDADFAAARAAGFSEDELFELVISAAVGQVGAEDMRQVLSAGVSREQVEDALAVCAAFNTTDRLADAFGFEELSPEGFEAGAKYLLKRGYR
jgi:alkylhydroperoxidase/carboxymuconolactone decarboxylase family protein YurZ